MRINLQNTGKSRITINHIIGIVTITLMSIICHGQPKIENTGGVEQPRIVNIVNFIRLLEPRYNSRITEEILYQTVVSQLDLMKKYRVGGTFLLQYDALMDSRYQKLLKELPAEYEVGAWWEIPQPLVEKAGLKWRGRYSWDWHANVGFSIGYTPNEREKLVDIYFEDFKKIFGYYPKSVGSWFIDEVTLNHMYEKYGIIASCNCRDQIGTDGYTIWGGYWNQGYYPSKVNSYMPAQNSENQIPVPIFRMLGSDPVRQYDDGIGKLKQGVITLEPVYKNGGGDSAWVNWYFNEFVEGPCINYAYVQSGQENSFTWAKMEKGFTIQIPLIAKLRDEGKIKVKTLAESGAWFKKNFKVTPPTSLTALGKFANDDRKTVWFNSRFYRTNIIWEKGSLRFRDIHLFDEKLQSDYLNKNNELTTCNYYTLPFVDGKSWSDSNHYAGLYLKSILNGKEVLLEGGMPIVNDTREGTLKILWPLKNAEGVFLIEMNEREIKMKLESKLLIDWFLEFEVSERFDLPIKNMNENRIECKLKEHVYNVYIKNGSYSTSEKRGYYKLLPEKEGLIIDLSIR